jgi:hypothetical protein
MSDAILAITVVGTVVLALAVDAAVLLALIRRNGGRR